MQRNKSTKTEKIILILLLIVLVAVIIWAYCVFTGNSIFNNNKVESYEKTYFASFNKNLDEIDKFKVPYQNNINKENSTYEAIITQTDNYIKNYDEKITLYYTDLTKEQFQEVEDYCHAYDAIEYDYTLTCSVENNRITMINSFNLESLDGNTKIETDDLNFEIDLKYNDLYDKYESEHNIEAIIKEPEI